MNRREFLKHVGLYAAGAMVLPPVFNVMKVLAEEPPAPNPKLVVTESKNHEQLVAKVLAPFGGMSAFVKRGDRVVVKPNIGWDRSPEQAATTNPVIVVAIIKLALEAGAAKVAVFDRTCNDERRCYANSGIKAAVDGIGDKRVSCDYVDSRKFVPVRIQNGKAITEWPLYQDALEADCYINVPIAKDHGLSKLTLGLKNVMGVMGGNRGKIHSKLGPSLADVATVIKPKLTIIDATRILLRNGPVGGNLDDVKIVNTLIASPDIVAADAYATTLFGFEASDIESTRQAAERGLGIMDLQKITIVRV